MADENPSWGSAILYGLAAFACVMVSYAAFKLMALINELSK